MVPIGTADEQWFLDFNNTPFVRKYLWDDAPVSKELARDIIEQNKGHFEEDQYGLWKILANDIPIGYVGLWYFFQEAQPQLIYALGEEFSGKGYATEASRSVIDYCFDSLGFTYLVAATDEPHLASQKLALRLGFKFVEKRLEDGKPTLFYKLKRTSNS